MMNYLNMKIKHIYEDDYGCEESEIIYCIVELEDENGTTSTVRVPDRFLKENELNTGSCWNGEIQ